HEAVATAPGVLLHLASPVRQRYSELVQAAAQAVAFAVENSRLQAMISAEIYQVTLSAARLAAAVDAEHRSIEATVSQLRRRELAGLSAAIARLSADEDPGLRNLAEDGLAAADRAATDLGRLAAGLAPAELAQLGLARAVKAAASRLSPH